MKPSSKPYMAIVDITNMCNLQCYFCPTGKQLYGRTPTVMDISHIENLLEKLGKYLYVAYLFSWGEPLLHPEVAKIIRLVHSHKVLTTISTNLNIKNQALLEEVCCSGLDYLTLSIDGATQEVYSKYRVGGNLDLVLENLRHIVDYKRKKKLRTPIIEWQFLIFDHNRHEVEPAQKLAKSIGVDIFRATPGVVPSNFQNNWQGYKACPFLWNTITLQVDGGIGACCNLIDKKDDFGDLSSQPFREIWHGTSYEVARSLFSPKWSKKLQPDLKHPCLYCSLVRLQPHLHNFLKTNIHLGDSGDIHKDDTIAVRFGNKGAIREDSGQTVSGSAQS